MPSALTAIAHGLPWYRGLAVPDLAGARGFEEVAEWLWTGRFPDPGPRLAAGRRRPGGGPARPGRPPPHRPAPGADPGDRRRPGRRGRAAPGAPPRGRHRRRPVADRRPGRLPRLAPQAAGRSAAARVRPGRPRSPPGCGPGSAPADPAPGLVGVVDAALVLLADHELAASTVAARVAASVRADPYAVVSAGLATVSGTLHGGASLGIEALLGEIDRPADGGRRGRGAAAPGRAPPRLRPPPLPGRRPARRGPARPPARAPPPGRRDSRWWRRSWRPPPAVASPTPNVDLALAALAHVTGHDPRRRRGHLRRRPHRRLDRPRPRGVRPQHPHPPPRPLHRPAPGS